MNSFLKKENRNIRTPWLRTDN